MTKKLPPASVTIEVHIVQATTVVAQGIGGYVYQKYNQPEILLDGGVKVGTCRHTRHMKTAS